MKIGMLAPILEMVPPKSYGGIERVVSELTEDLIQKGHKVTLFASGDSKTQAKLISIWPKAIWWDKTVKNDTPLSLLNVANVFRLVSQFDLIHSHVGYFALPFIEYVKIPVLTTLHGIIPEYQKPIFRAYKNFPYISISNNQRKELRELNYFATIYNGTNTNLYTFNEKPQDYLLFMGRCSPEKGPQFAIEVAKKSKMKLVMAMRVNPVDQKFYKKEIEPLLKSKYIEILGEITDRERVNLYQNAKATLFPISWEEPFGLVMTESMACGSPVIAFNRGSVPEIIKDGKTGFICQNISQMVKAVKKIDQIRREDCREHITKNFSIEKMVDEYEKVYKKLVKKSKCKM